jgi:hypothetical protein
LALGNCGAKGSSLPVVALALAITALALLVIRRRIPWPLVAAGLICAAGQLFATVVLYKFQTYGVAFGPLSGLSPFWGMDPSAIVVTGVWIAFVLNMLLRLAGLGPLLWLTRGRLDPAQWLLVSGGVAGVAFYLVLSQPGSGNQYFLRTGFAFGVIGSAWGYALVVDRARLSTRALLFLGVGTVAYASVLIGLQFGYAGSTPDAGPIGPLLPMLNYALWLAVAGVAAANAWLLAGRRFHQLRGRGPLVVLTAVLVAGIPGLVMDGAKSVAAPNGGAYPTILLPASRVDAARWVRDHSDPDDVLATNSHCISGKDPQTCDTRSFWLTAYAERSVLIEGWGFAPRNAAVGLIPFWDSALLDLNERVFTAPTEADLTELRDRYGVRWLVVDRSVRREGPSLFDLADPVFDNGRVAVFHLR